VPGASAVTGAGLNGASAANTRCVLYLGVIDTRDRPESLEGLPNFLVDHVRCGKGFDLTHPEGLGAGLISMTCRSCGESFEFVPTSVEVEREVVIAPVDEDPIKGPPARSRRDRIIVALLLAFSIAAFAFSIYRVLDDHGNSVPSETPAAKPQKAARPAPLPAAAPTRRVTLPGSTMRVPADWSKTSAGAATVLAPKRGPRVVSIRFFNTTDPQLTTARMIAGIRGFLSSQPPKGTALPVRRTRVGADVAFTTGENGPAGFQQALGVLAGATRYLLIGTADPAATAVEVRQMRRALTSFRRR
jgi:hypothetical protein